MRAASEDSRSRYHLRRPAGRPEGGRYLGAGRFHGRGKGSNAEFDVPMAWVYITEDDELFLRYEAYFEREKALQSLGLDRWPG